MGGGCLYIYIYTKWRFHKISSRGGYPNIRVGSYVGM